MNPIQNTGGQQIEKESPLHANPFTLKVSLYENSMSVGWQGGLGSVKSGRNIKHDPHNTQQTSCCSQCGHLRTDKTVAPQGENGSRVISIVVLPLEKDE